MLKKKETKDLFENKENIILAFSKNYFCFFDLIFSMFYVLFRIVKN